MASVTIPHNKNTNAPRREKYHEKYEIWILYFSYKYEYNIPNKHLKQASQIGEHKDSQTKEIDIYLQL